MESIFFEEITNKNNKNSNEKNNIIDSFIQINENKEEKFILLEDDKILNSLTEEEWKKIIKSHKNLSELPKEKISLIINSLENGINSNLRESIWKLISKSENLKLNHKKNYYFQLLKIENTEIENKIKKDLERTFISNSLNLNKNSLFNILKAYSIYDKQISYSQGTNFIVYVLLNVVKNEEDSFWLFVSIMIEKKWRLNFLKNNNFIIILLNKFLQKLQINFPLIYEHFEKINFIDSIPGIFSQFYLTIFSYENIPIEFSLRIFDLFWIFSDEIITNSLINMLNLEKNEILKMEKDELYIFIKNDFVKNCIEKFGIDYCIDKKNMTNTKNKILTEKEIIFNFK